MNLLAANLTTQVRAIAEVATAVTKGDLTRSIQVEARGEVAELKDNINTMIDNLRLTTDRNTEQDWLKTNLARFTNMLQGQRDLATVGRMLLSESGAAGRVRRTASSTWWIRRPSLEPAVARCLRGRWNWAIPEHLHVGEGLIGQCAADGRRMLVTTCRTAAVPIRSGLFKATPTNVVVLPVLFEGQVKAVIELALGRFVHRSADVVPGAAHRRHRHRAELDRGDDADRRSAEAVAAARHRTADAAARAAADERTARAEGAAARRTNVEVERKNQEIEQARRAVEEQGDGAGADLEVQVGVPGQHVARAAHAAELDPDPGPAAWRQSGRQPDAAPGRIRAHHPRRGHRPAEPDQRHSRPVEDRIRHGVGGGRGNLVLQPEGDRHAAIPPRSGEPRPVL